MKVHEIITEEEQLNEFVPIVLGGLGWGAAITAIGAFLTGLSIIEIYQLVNKYSDEPENMSDDDWDTLFIDVALLALPGAAKLGKAVLMKTLPKSVLRRGGSWLRKRVLDKVKKERATNRQKVDNKIAKGVSPQKAADLKKTLAARNAKAAAKAKATVDKFPEKLLTMLNLGIGVNFAYDYWTKLMELEDDYELAKNGDPTTKSFGTAIEYKAQLLADAEQRRKQLLGELTIGVGATLARMPAAKATKFLGSIFGGVAGGRGTLTGGLVALPFDIASKLIQHAGPGLALFMQTETGKKFLNNYVVAAITRGIGTLTNEAQKLLYSAVDELGKMVGVDNATGGIRSKIDKDQQAADAAAGAANPAGLLDKTPSKMKVTYDPKNPKIMYIGGYQITDADGYQIAGDAYIKDIRDDARALKMPDPTANLKKRPA